MARRSGGTHKGVEEKRRSLPIYQHYTLSPGKTKSHHPEAKCNHCLKEFVCGSKQRLIRHLRKCNSITNPDQIIAETLNTLARNSATGTLNHSILEASNLLPSQLAATQQQHLQNHHQHHHHQQQQHQHQHVSSNHHHQQQIAIGHHQQQLLHHSPTMTTTTTINSSNNNINSNNNNNNNNINSNHTGSTVATTSCSPNETGLMASNSSNGASGLPQQVVPFVAQPSMASPVKRPQRRGRRPVATNLLATSSPTIHVTTGLDGKTHFTPASQLPPGTAVNTGPIIAQVSHNGRQTYTYAAAVATPGNNPSGGAGPLAANLTTGAVIGSAANPGHLACATPNHHHHHHSSSIATAYKLNSDPIDKAYLKLVLTRNLPLSLCDTKEFQSWVKTFANDYKPPSSINLIAQNLKNESQAAKQRISNILVKAPKKTINLELHNWSDNIRGHVWYAIIANIDLKRFLISVRDIYPPTSTLDQNDEASLSHSTAASAPDALETTISSSQAEQAGSGTSLVEFIDDCIKRVGSDRINSLVFANSCEKTPLMSNACESLYATNPSIVTYNCWWRFTNSLCSELFNQNELFQNVLRNSNRLINFVSKRANIGRNLEKFNPFVGVSGSIYQKKNDRRWYSHLVCYLLEYIKNNNEAITRALEAYSTSAAAQSHLSSDNNNNSASDSSNNINPQVVIQRNSSTQQQTILYQEDSHLMEIKSLILSSEYWTNLNLVLLYLKPIHELVALTSTVSINQNNIHSASSQPPSGMSIQPNTPAISPIIANHFLLSDYMHWFLKYGKTLFDSWMQGPDSFKHQLINSYLTQFKNSFSEFKLLFAAYLLNPRHRCAYLTQKSKDIAIEEILNIASEFMPEESDGHTIFDQWKLYLVREEPYDMVFDETCSTPLDWWMSLPCAESIRRVALRILRLKAFTSPRPETLFSQLYFYEDEMKTNFTRATFEDIAVMRYFYDYEDKVGQNAHQNSFHSGTTSTNNVSNPTSTNGYIDRSQLGHLHNEQMNQSSFSAESIDIGSETNGQINNESLSLSDGRHSFSDSFTDVVVESYINHNSLSNMDVAMDQEAGLSLEDLPGFKLFTQFVDYNELGVQFVEEPTEKKRRKWTAQEILSKCQPNHQNSEMTSK